MAWMEKCDEALPACAQCIRGGRVCPGYARGLRFVDEGPKLRRRTRPASVRAARNKVEKTPGFPRLGSAAIVAESSIERRTANSLSSSDNRLPGQGKFGINELNSPGLTRTQIMASFVSAMFPLGVVSAQSSFLGSWLWHLPPRFGQSVVLDRAATALAFAYFARVSDDRLVLRNSEQCYVLALEALARAIGDSKEQQSTDVLCATWLLGFYEVGVYGYCKRFASN
jgi:hypothetical protein